MVKNTDKVWPGVPTIEGAGVKLQRAFGFREAPRLDPFLLLDDFHSADPQDYIAGFPWHPHRGIETVTYMLSGTVNHGDSLGNSGSIGRGDVQWMTAGSGIIHQEMPQATEGMLQGFQLWINLPRRQKMMHPRYRDISAGAIPLVSPVPGVQVKLISGRLQGNSGPVQDLVVPVEFLDVLLQAGVSWDHSVAPGWRSFAYVYGGETVFAEDSSAPVASGHTALLGPGSRIRMQARGGEARLLLVSGLPLSEPVAWKGPIVMNTQAELAAAFAEYRAGTFLRSGRVPS